MAKTNKTEPKIQVVLNLYRQNTILAVTGIAAIIAGFIFPGSAVLIDLLLVLTITLTGAVIAVALSDKKTDELKGFTTLAIATAAIQLTIAIAFVKLILTQASAGSLISIVKHLNLSGELLSPLFNVLIFGLNAIVWFVFILILAKKVIVRSDNCIEQITAIELSPVDEDFSIINTTPTNQIQQAKAFFISIAAFARFNICSSVIILITILIALFTAVAAPPTNSNGSVSANAYISLVTSSAIIIQTISSFLIWAVLKRTNKNAESMILKNVVCDELSEERIKVTASEISNDIKHYEPEQIYHLSDLNIHQEVEEQQAAALRMELSASSRRETADY